MLLSSVSRSAHIHTWRRLRTWFRICFNAHGNKFIHCSGFVPILSLSMCVQEFVCSHSRASMRLSPAHSPRRNNSFLLLLVMAMGSLNCAARITADWRWQQHTRQRRRKSAQNCLTHDDDDRCEQSDKTEKTKKKSPRQKDKSNARQYIKCVSRHTVDRRASVAILYRSIVYPLDRSHCEFFFFFSSWIYNPLMKFPMRERKTISPKVRDERERNNNHNQSMLSWLSYFQLSHMHALFNREPVNRHVYEQHQMDWHRLSRLIRRSL